MRQFVCVVSLAIALSQLAACTAKPPAQSAPPVVAAAAPLRMTVVDWDDFLGQFVAMNAVDIRPRVSGYLQSVNFKDGDIVRKGQLLFVVDPRPYQAALDQAKGQAAHAAAAAANAHAEAVRGQALVAAHAISQQAYDALSAAEQQSAADLASAQASVRTDALNLSFTRITAPISGRISDHRISAGNLVAADTTVLTNIVDLDPIRFTFTGSEALFLKYQRAGSAGAVGAPVEIRLQDEPTYRWKGRVDFIDNGLDPSAGVIRGRAVLANPAHLLAPGLFGHMRLSGAKPYSALLIPDRAILTDQSRQIVYAVGADGKVTQKTVTLGPLYQGLRVIRTGLAADDQVIIDGAQRAKVGQSVSVKALQISADAGRAEDPSAAAPPPTPQTATPAGPVRAAP